jgi:REP element-mobilizing transposase RayT
MPHTYASNFIHCVFSTKERKPIIPPDRMQRLWAYIAGIGQGEGLTWLAAGGTINHAHLLFVLPAACSLAQAVQKLKGKSSLWMGPDFSWQEGYGAFSVSASQIPAVKEYIHNQAEHHKNRSFEEEFISLLEHYGIEYDPKYVFG